MSRTTGVKNGTQQQVSRRKKVITMLTKQLYSELKMEKNRTDGHKIPLTDKDIVRIKKEIETLKTKI